MKTLVEQAAPNVIPENEYRDQFMITSIGLKIEGSPSQEEWYDFFHLLGKGPKSLHWIIGDWLNYGTKQFRLSYEKVSAHLKAQGFSFTNQTLRNDKYVSARIPLSWRHDKLTWQHHKEVASLNPDQQQYWLSYAEKKEISTKELRKLIQGTENIPWLRVSNIWEFGACDDNFGMDSPHRVPGQILQNLLFYYSGPVDLVIDPMSRDGTIVDVCTKCDETKRKYFAFDINPLRPDILTADVRKPWPNTQMADFIFINGLRGNILRFNHNFQDTLRKILGEASYNLNTGGVLSVIIEPSGSDNIEEYRTDWSFVITNWIKHEINLKFLRRIIIPIPLKYIRMKQRVYAKENNSFYSSYMEVLVFKKENPRKCTRCGILLHNAEPDNTIHDRHEIMLCPNCLRSLGTKIDVIPKRASTCDEPN